MHYAFDPRGRIVSAPLAYAYLVDFPEEYPGYSEGRFFSLAAMASSLLAAEAVVSAHEVSATDAAMTRSLMSMARAMLLCRVAPDKTLRTSANFAAQVLFGDVRPLRMATDAVYARAASCGYAEDAFFDAVAFCANGAVTGEPDVIVRCASADDVRALAEGGLCRQVYPVCDLDTVPRRYRECAFNLAVADVRPSKVCEMEVFQAPMSRVVDVMERTRASARAKALICHPYIWDVV